MTNWVPDLAAHPGPRYRALAAAIEADMEAGRLQPGQRLPTHRALAEALRVTVGTVTRGYTEAERRGLVRARVGSGTYVEGGMASGSGFSIPGRADGATVNLGLSFPVPSARREALLAATLREIAADPAALADAVSYQSEQGLPSHRRIAAHWLTDWGFDFDPDELVVTLGGQHGIHLALQTIARPGELIASAGLTYPGLIAAARELGLRHTGLPFDEEGLIPESFERLCQQQAPRALYCTPNQNNPTTECLTAERRGALVDIARRHGVLLIEDDIHLVPPAERPESLVSLAPEQVIHISGCSKVLAGGLRVGFLRVPARHLAAVGSVLRSHCWMSPPLSAEVATRWMESGAAAQLARWQLGEIRARQAMVGDHLRGYGFHRQSYGFNVWLELPEPWRAGAFVERCRQRRLLIKTGEPFAVGGYPVGQAVRICVSAAPDRETLATALTTIREILDEVPRVSLSVV